MKSKLKLLFPFFAFLLPLHVAAQKLVDIYPDTWVATDGIGRTLPGADETPLKTDRDRFVGIFYITWHTQGLHDGRPYQADVSRVLDADPGATRNADSPAWTTGSYHWGEPEYGYFLSRDEYVIRHDMSMLADAGVDVIILDVTNAVCYWDEWDVIFRVMTEMKAEGNRVPQFCFWAFNGNVITVVKNLYERYYKTPSHQDLWFMWEGKPLLLCNATPWVDANPGGGQKDATDYPQEIKDFFTLRNMWWGYDTWAGKPYVGTEDNWSFGYQLNDESVYDRTPEQRAATHNGRHEEYAVTPAQHPISIVGKSWRDTEPALDDKDMPIEAYVPALDKTLPSPTQYGIYFQDRWDEALAVDPDFIYLNDWNEWTAGKYRNGKDPTGQADMQVDFLGRSDNPFYFVDQYNAEFNRTIAPMKGGYTDNYYMQMVQNIRRYKDVRDIPVSHGLSRVSVDGSFADWDAVDIVFRDTRGDVIHRDHDGYGDLHYTDISGRNDIVASRVAVNRRNVCFEVETAAPLTSAAEPAWMILFIDADADASTGWNGCDYLVRRGDADEDCLTLYRYERTEWESVCAVPYTVDGNRLELAIPRKAIEAKGKAVTFNFKWSDNPTDSDDFLSVVTTGDTAPNRRFFYRFRWTAK